MTPQQEQHLQKIKEEFCRLYDVKYRAGQKEHGGNLWDKANKIDLAIEEALDLVGYLLTLKQQIKEHKDFDKNKIKE